MDTWLLCQEDIVRLLNVVGRDALMQRMIWALEAGFTDLGHGRRAESPMRSGFTRSGDIPGVIEIMPHREPEVGVTVKTVSYSPHNVGIHNLPTILGTVARIEDDTGRLIALADGALLTALRTGAATAVATRRLAHPDSRVVGLIGTGAQSVTQLHGLSQIMEIGQVLAYDIKEQHAKSFYRRAAFLGLDIELASPERILAESDVLCTATSVPVGEGPVFADGEHHPHLHINSLGADEVGKTELPVSLLQRALVCVDHLEQARREGECQQLLEDEIGPSLAYLCAHPDEWVHHRESLTVFDSTGVAFEDHIAFDVITAAAKELGLGTKLTIECQPEDVLDPYSLRGHVPAAPQLTS